MTAVMTATPATAESPQAQTPAPRWPLWAAAAAATAVLFALCLRLAGQIPVMSDGAANAMQAWDMLHGNLLLRGWTLTDLSFYTTELPEYMITEQLRGLGPGAAHLAAALTYTLLVAGVVLLARGRATGPTGVVRGLLAAGVMITPLGFSDTTVLADPDHVGTQVPLVLAWLIIDRARPGWRPAAAVTAILAWCQVADPLVTYEGVLAIVIVYGIRLYQRQAGRYELALAAGAICSTAIADLALRAIRHAGGFVLTPLDTTFTAVATLSGHLFVSVQSVLIMYGADFSGQQLGLSAAARLVHLAAVAAAGWATVHALRRFGDSDLVVRLIAVAIVVQLAAFTIGGSNVAGGAHEIAGVLPAGAVLAARLLADRLLAGRLLADQLLTDRRPLALAAAVLACFGAILLHETAKAAPPDRDGQLAVWLRAHHLRYGLAAYWNAASVTVDSGGAVQVRPIGKDRRGDLAVVHRDTVASWYNPALHDADFLVLPRRGAGCLYGARWQWVEAVRTDFGPPAASYRAAGFTVLVWHNNLLRHLRQMPPGAC